MLLTSPCIPEDDLKDRVLGATHSLQQAAWALPGGKAVAATPVQRTVALGLGACSSLAERQATSLKQGGCSASRHGWLISRPRLRLLTKAASTLSLLLGTSPGLYSFRARLLFWPVSLAQDHQGFLICIFQARGLCIPFLKCG